MILFFLPHSGLLLVPVVSLKTSFPPEVGKEKVGTVLQCLEQSLNGKKVPGLGLALAFDIR